jgi:hypothetical protein
MIWVFLTTRLSASGGLRSRAQRSQSHFFLLSNPPEADWTKTLNRFAIIKLHLILKTRSCRFYTLCTIYIIKLFARRACSFTPASSAEVKILSVRVCVCQRLIQITDSLNSEYRAISYQLRAMSYYTAPLSELHVHSVVTVYNYLYSVGPLPVRRFPVEINSEIWQISRCPAGLHQWRISWSPCKYLVYQKN